MGSEFEMVKAIEQLLVWYWYNLATMFLTGYSPVSHLYQKPYRRILQTARQVYV